MNASISQQRKNNKYPKNIIFFYIITNTFMYIYIDTN